MRLFLVTFRLRVLRFANPPTARLNPCILALQKLSHTLNSSSLWPIVWVQVNVFPDPQYINPYITNRSPVLGTEHSNSR